jgi:hypothetical protein
MKANWIIVLLVSFVGFSGIPIAGQSTRPQNSQPPLVSISLKQPKSSFKLGREVTVDMTTTNISTDNVMIAPIMTIEMWDAEGRPVPRVKRTLHAPRSIGGMIIPLEAGKSMINVIDLSHTFSITKAGKYRVTIKSLRYGDPRGKPRDRIKSNTISIQIVK